MLQLEQGDVSLGAVGALGVAFARRIFGGDENLRNLDLGRLGPVVTAVADHHLARTDGAFGAFPAGVHAVGRGEHPLFSDYRTAAKAMIVLK